MWTLGIKFKKKNFYFFFCPIKIEIIKFTIYYLEYIKKKND